MVGRKLATQGSEEDREGFYHQMSESLSLPNHDFLRILLDNWIDKAIKTAPFKRRLYGLHSSVTNQNLSDALAMKSGGIQNCPMSLPPHLRFVPLPSSKRKSPLAMSSEEVANQREAKDQRDLDVWSTRLFHIYEAKDAPVARQISGCLNPGRATLEIAGATRPRTLKLYIQHWSRFESYLEKSVRKSWPSCPEDYINYIHMLADEPCGPTVPESFIMAARFVERKSDLPTAEVFADSPLVKAVLMRTVEKLRGPTGPTKRAPRFPSVMIEALEGLVLDASAPKYSRGVAWLRLVKVWTRCVSHVIAISLHPDCPCLKESSSVFLRRPRPLVQVVEFESFQYTYVVQPSSDLLHG